MQKFFVTGHIASFIHMAACLVQKQDKVTEMNESNI